MGYKALVLAAVIVMAVFLVIFLNSGFYRGFVGMDDIPLTQPTPIFGR